MAVAASTTYRRGPRYGVWGSVIDDVGEPLLVSRGIGAAAGVVGEVDAAAGPVWGRRVEVGEDLAVPTRVSSGAGLAVRSGVGVAISVGAATGVSIGFVAGSGLAQAHIAPASIRNTASVSLWHQDIRTS